MSAAVNEASQSELDRKRPAQDAVEREDDSAVGREDLLVELIFQDPEMQRLIQDFDLFHASRKGEGYLEDQATVDGDTLCFDEGEAVTGEGVVVATADSLQEFRQNEANTSHELEQSQPPLANCTDFRKVARYLQKTYVTFSSLGEDSIVQLLQKGAKSGIQPKLFNSKQRTPVPMVVSRRTGRKRGPYKMTKKDSWTNCTKRGRTGSGSALHNVSQKKRSPLSPFKERILTVNDIDLHQESMGEGEVR